MGPNSGVQEYCLRWNNHHSTLVSVMDALLQKGSLVDVTLAAEGKSIQVHRLVLCACSSYFQELLSQHWDKQAVVFLKDVKFEQLRALVDYMYRGEVNVSQDQLAAFLNTAEALKVKGLADGDRDKDRKNEKRLLDKIAARSSSPATAGSNRPVKRARKVSKDEVNATDKTILPLLPSLVRIPQLPNESVNDSPTENETDHDLNSNPLPSNPEGDANDTEQFSVVEPKIETEHEGELSGASGDDEEWSDSEYSSRLNASQGDASWNDEYSRSGNQEGILSSGQSQLDNDPNSSSRGSESSRGIASRKKRYAPNAQGRYDCIQCGRSYAAYHNLMRHMRYECGLPPRFPCQVCGRYFRRKDDLHRHIARIHGKDYELVSS